MTDEKKNPEAAAETNGSLSPPPDASRSLPPLTVKNVILDIVTGVSTLITEPSAKRVIIPIIVCLSSMICKVIISKVAYTEIDFTTYMQQIELINDGALDYSIIVGDTGPIVYPAGFVQIYQGLYSITDGGADLKTAQLIFGYLFTFTVILTCIVYSLVDNFPPWPFYLLLCSKRLFSIYVLRMFNDCFATLGMVTVVLVLQQASNMFHASSDFMMFLLCAVAADIFSMALSVKMNVLLYLPAFAVVVYFLLGERLISFLAVLAVIPLVQVLIGWRFLLPLFWDEEARSLRWIYLTRAFDFSRKFLYEWTVNWRFIPEEIFTSVEFSKVLLGVHVLLLSIFMFTRFLSPRLTGKPISTLIMDAVLKPFSKSLNSSNLLTKKSSGPRLVLLIFAVTNLIGVLCARSLHYQFLSWYCWSFPFLLHASNCNVVVGMITFFAHEWCWNVFPSTNESSELLVAILAATIFAIWNNTKYWFDEGSIENTEAYIEKNTGLKK